MIYLLISLRLALPGSTTDPRKERGRALSPGAHHPPYYDNPFFSLTHLFVALDEPGPQGPQPVCSLFGRLEIWVTLTLDLFMGGYCCLGHTGGFSGGYWGTDAEHLNPTTHVMETLMSAALRPPLRYLSHLA